MQGGRDAGTSRASYQPGYTGSESPQFPPPVPPPLPPRNQQRAANRMYISGSAAPPIVSMNRRPTHPTSPNPPPLPPRALHSPQAMVFTQCTACGAQIRYPAPGPTNVSCRVCGTAFDPISQSAPPPLAPGFSADEIHELAIQLRRDPLLPIPVEDPELRLIRRTREVFSSWRSMQTSCCTATSDSLPSFELVRQLYLLVEANSTALDALRETVGWLLRRPRLDVSPGPGAWILLFEAPMFKPSCTPNVALRIDLYSQAVDIISTQSDETHAALVGHLTSPNYHKELLQSKIDMLVSCLSVRVNEGLGSPAGPLAHWSIRPCARIGALLFAANQIVPRVPISNFYVPLLDMMGPTALLQSFDLWSGRSQEFSICQYPFLISLGIKVHFLALDGARQMIDTHRTDLKKSLRVVFEGEEGVDAGGVRKEWFLVLCRQLFDPQYGMFTYQESGLCYFNPAALETSDEFRLVGVILGLALYNAVTLDVPLPLAVYKKLTGETVGLADLAVFNPELAAGLRQLLDYEGDVAETFCRFFVGDFEAWGEVQEVELVPGGADIPVDATNRREFVNLYVAFVLSTSVASQFESFAAGFRGVCFGNAFSLLKGEEIELLVRGSSEPLDVDALKGVTVYEGFGGEEDVTIQFFWEVFIDMSQAEQRKLLSFITGSDRIPATGTSAMTLKITCMGEDVRRFPTSHTCFNQLVLPRYLHLGLMQSRLKTAMEESEGFGLK